MKNKLKLAWEFTGHILPFAMALLLLIRGIQVLDTDKNAAMIMLGVSVLLMVIGDNKKRNHSS